LEQTIQANAEEKAVAASAGFPPIARGDARILILGSLPGQRSLDARQYYAHPQNAFWRIMRDLVGAEGTYERRCRALLGHRIALWDVLASSVRPGSMDADIRLKTAQANDFNEFFINHRELERIAFNGRKAAQLFASMVELPPRDGVVGQFVLPSTSPAYASMSYAAKLDAWRRVLA